MAPSCLWHASVSSIYVRSDRSKASTDVLTSASFICRNEFISAFFMSGNVSPLSLRSFLLRGAVICVKFEKIQQYMLHTRGRIGVVQRLSGVSWLARHYKFSKRHGNNLDSRCGLNI